MLERSVFTKVLIDDEVANRADGCTAGRRNDPVFHGAGK
jgi:hypothetical protein